MGIEYRRARLEDLRSVESVFASAIDDLDRKHGFFESPTSINPLNPRYAFWLEKEPGAFWVAEDRGSVVGYAFSFVRGEIWYLADLFILPGSQGKGVGGSLIQRTLGSWKGRRISNRALMTPAFNRVSVSLYMRFGMLPRQPAYFATASRKKVVSSLGPRMSRTLEVEELSDIRPVSRELDRVHRLALGFPSGWHNQYFSEVQRARCLVFRRRGIAFGYAFLRPNGRIGPLVTESAGFFRPALEATLRTAAEGDSGELTILFPGTNEQAVRASIRHSFRITYPLLFLSSKPMGDLGNYLFYSPGLM